MDKLKVLKVVGDVLFVGGAVVKVAYNIKKGDRTLATVAEIISKVKDTKGV